MKSSEAIMGLEFATNMFGKLSPTIIKRIQRFMKHPNKNTWDDIHSIIIDRTNKMRTIWQAVIEIKPSFPKSGRCEDFEGNVIKDWSEIPTPNEVVKAINNCVFKTHLEQYN